jgi:undecaprenyl-diphosphatase
VPQLLELEREAFLWLNGIGRSPFLDEFMWLFSGKVAWVPVATVFVGMLFWRNASHWREALLALVAVAVVITISDQFASGFCKPFFHRFRPTHHPDFMNDVKTVFGYKGGRYGFISSHAANGFGFATVSALLFRYKPYTITIFLWALITSYSRIYLGVHFLSDILFGSLVGVVTGVVIASITRNLTPSFNTAASVGCSYHSRCYAFPRQNIKVIIYGLIATALCLCMIAMIVI